MQDSPFVTIIMPIRNEAEFIERAIKSVLDNDYPTERMEILVIDGMSNDGTREIVASLSKTGSRIKLLDNPKRITPAAMNIGIKAAQGEMFIRVDGHVEIPADYITKSIQCLHEHPQAWVAGGYIKTVADSFVGRTIAAAMQSPIGVGNSRFRLGDYEGWVDTLAFGAHHKWVVDKIGYFNGRGCIFQRCLELLLADSEAAINVKMLLKKQNICFFFTYYKRTEKKHAYA